MSEVLMDNAPPSSTEMSYCYVARAELGSNHSDISRLLESGVMGWITVGGMIGRVGGRYLASLVNCTLIR